MSRDFAHKPRPQASSGIPRWVWVFTTLVAVSFAGFLYYLAQIPPEESGAEAVRRQLTQALQDTETTSPEPAPAPNDRVEDIKEQAESLKQAFEFYELLKKDEVPIVVETAPSAPSTPSGNASPNVQPNQVAVPTAQRWVIQVASFRRVEDADRTRANLILNGLPNTEIVTVDLGDSGIFHRVIVGPFDQRSALSKAQDVLAELEYAVIVRGL